MIPNCEHSEQIDKLVPALIKAIGKMEAAYKDSTNPAFKSKYADLSSIMDACKPALEENGIAVLQPPTNDAEGVHIATILLHNSGQWIASKLTLMPKDGSPQATGSAITYGRRYGLSGILGMTADDDDGNAASGQGTKAAAQAVAQQKIATMSKPAAAPVEQFPADTEDLKKLLDQLEADPQNIRDLGEHFREIFTETLGAEKWLEARKISLAGKPPSATTVRRLYWMAKTGKIEAQP